MKGVSHDERTAHPETVEAAGESHDEGSKKIKHHQLFPFSDLM
jgi:hypothetical protein